MRGKRNMGRKRLRRCARGTSPAPVKEAPCAPVTQGEARREAPARDGAAHPGELHRRRRRPSNVLPSLARRISAEKVERYQLQLIQGRKLSWSTTNRAASAFNFLYRVTLKRAITACRVTSLSAPEFIRRFFMHVLPQGFKRIRHYGLLASGHKAAKLGLCRTLFDMPAPQPALLESVADFVTRVAQGDITRCSKCEDVRLRFAAASAGVYVQAFHRATGMRQLQSPALPIRHTATASVSRDLARWLLEPVPARTRIGSRTVSRASTPAVQSNSVNLPR